MAQFGLLGEHLGHSFSPEIHKMFGDYPYALFEVPAAQLSSFFQTPAFDGLNVTIPYKKAVLPYCDVLSKEVQKIGSANTLLQKNGQLIAYNTDYFGFLYLVQKAGIQIQHKKCLVFGNGGVSLTVQVALADLGAEEVVVISRSGENNYQNLQKHTDAQILVNTTPLGMYPHNLESPVSLDRFPCCVGVLDLIYNPIKTKLILDAEAKGIRALGGLAMLVAQAKKASELFQNIHITDDTMEAVLDIIEAQKKNIVLIGMPGSGKSFLGHLAAQKLKRPFYDTDAEIEKRAGKSIPEIFKEDGEAAFRSLETAVLESLTKLSGAVIATGGGVVTRAENIPLLLQNSKIVWVKRSLSKLATDGRPLSAMHGLEALYAQRKEAYAALADVVYENEVEIK